VRHLETKEFARRAAERRNAARHAVRLQGRILGGPSVIYCALFDVSETGAKINLGATVVIPKRFRLQIERNNLVIVCHMQWRSGDFLGVAFDRPLDASEIEAARRKPLPAVVRRSLAQDVF
jgi:hypothetical protein